MDDNFATIVAAVEEGRIIFGNIVRFLTFLLSSNAGELFTMGIALALGMPLPLLPLQILWINLVTDGFPALGWHSNTVIATPWIARHAIPMRRSSIAGPSSTSSGSGS